jgi:thymidylate synthase ThyX
MSKITASVICDSIGEHSPRLTTFLTHYPKFVHSEHCRHRAFSLCVSSSRAIPSKRYLEIVRSDEERAEPAFWGAEQKGMSPGEELSSVPLWPKDGVISLADGSPKAEAIAAWEHSALNAAGMAEYLLSFGVHKSIANRLLDPFVPVNVLVTSCEAGLLNWFGLRLDKSADPTIRALAEAMWAAWNESNPQKLEPGEWHLPFITEMDFIEADRYSNEEHIQLRWLGKSKLDILKRVSTAHSARLSYMSYDTGKRATIGEDLALYDRLITAKPIHASPAEHQATPDRWFDWVDAPDVSHWLQPELHGNLPGWIQHRKTLPDEAIAPLPEGYIYNGVVG